VEEAIQQQAAPEETISSNQLRCLFETSDGVIVSDPKEQIIRINAAALKLFEVSRASLRQGTLYHQFLHQYEMDDEQQQAVALEPWLLSLITEGGVASNLPEQIKLLRFPSEKKSYVTLRSLQLHDAQKHVAGTVHVFHDITRKYQKALHLQRVQRAGLTLMEAIGHISKQMDLAFLVETLEESFLLLPPALAVGQQLVDVVRHVLDCCHVTLWAIGPPAGQVYFAAGSGITAEGEQYRREISGRFLLREIFGERSLDCLLANEVVMLPADDMSYPPEFRVDVRVKQWLMVPLLLEGQFAGYLVIGKADFAGGYTPEEIELVRAVATQALLVLDCFRCLCEQARTGSRALAQQEIQRLTNDFLNLASHELNTSLTVIKGNMQVAQRRLARLKHQITEQLEQVSEQIELPLASAIQHTRLQERMIKELIDDASIQANTLELHIKRCDLIALLKEAIARQQRSAPERTIILEVMTTEHVVPIIADAERITQVINAYLANALSSSPLDRPVTVQLMVEDARARVSVHDEGPGIPVEEQGHIWERFSASRELTGPQASELSLGLGLYLCQAFIERHHGSVGVHSDPGHGATFWFTLPIEASLRG
jgi:signal transduction histidine kinase